MLDKLINLNPVFLAFLATFFTYLMTLFGASLVFFFKRFNKTVMDMCLSVSAGVMLAASFWSLLNPGINLAYQLNKNAVLIAVIGFMSGGVLLYLGDILSNKLLNKSKNVRTNSLKRSLLLIISITLHNIPEGLAVGVSFGLLTHSLDTAILLEALIFSIGIGIQNFPEGSAVSIPLRREGYSIKKSFFYGQLSGLVEPISGVIGALLVIKVRNILPFFLCFAAGAMIYVVVLELIPESQSNNNKKLMTIFTLLGFVIMMSLDVLLG